MKLTERRLKRIVKEEVDKVLKEEDPEIGFENLPPGWDGDSVEDFAEDFVGHTREEGFFTDCMDEAEGEDWIDGSPERFCAALKDEIYGEGWREGPNGED